ncbi:UNVERIFIED_ORG: hypothetical protein BCL66_1219 [Martelella mediterranea]
MVSANTKRVAAVLSIIVLSGCVPQEQGTMIQQSNLRTTPHEPSIAAEQLRTCFAAGKLQKEISPDTVAHYSQKYTYALASLMKRSPDEISQFADNVRAYVYQFEQTSIFGTNQFNAVCYFGDLGNGPQFATMIITDSVDSVNRAEVAGALVETYENLSGEKLSPLRKAMLIMSTPA